MLHIRNAHLFLSRPDIFPIPAVESLAIPTTGNEEHTVTMIAKDAPRDDRRRKTHRKSRLGCRNCKLRRVKVSQAIRVGVSSSANLPQSAMKQNRNVKSVFPSELPVTTTVQLRTSSSLLAIQRISSPGQKARGTSLTLYLVQLTQLDAYYGQHQMMPSPAVCTTRIPQTDFTDSTPEQQ